MELNPPNARLCAGLQHLFQSSCDSIEGLHKRNRCVSCAVLFRDSVHKVAAAGIGESRDVLDEFLFCGVVACFGEDLLEFECF